MRLRLNLAYDGTEYRGWQVQPDAVTVQETLEKALSRLFAEDSLRVIAAGRTDAGVHAVGQVVHFDPPAEREERTILRALNSLLPDDIHVWRVRGVSDQFHARYSAHERVYGYRIFSRTDLFGHRYGWFPKLDFDPSLAEDIARDFVGRHNYRAFSTRPDSETDPLCEVREIAFEAMPGGWLLRISADRFLRRMVRTVVGTVVEAAAGKFDRGEIGRLLEAGEGRAAAPAPPQGLALLRVRYETDDDFDRPGSSPWGEKR